MVYAEVHSPECTAPRKKRLRGRCFCAPTVTALAASLSMRTQAGGVLQSVHRPQVLLTMRTKGKVQTTRRTRGPAAHRYTHLEGLTHVSQCRSQALLGRCSQASKRRRSARQRVAVTIVRCVPTPVAGTALSPPRVRRAIRGVGKGHARQRRRRHTTTPTPGSNGLHSGRRVVGARTG